jgi:DnaJ-class molecular chaperone
MPSKPCETCDGEGRLKAQGGRYLVPCKPCAGTGKKYFKTRICDACQGSRINGGACTACMGQGTIPEESA